ncbi:MAG: 3-hydroxybutyryl-CoA dehydrogenase [Ignavibacteria bacterium]|nr:3-hydroxybutyryl-CoA dehydrogenase [Ignavibacteria bacterium]
MTIGICGAGTMGRGIAVAALLAGNTVVLFDISADACSAAEKYIAAQLEKAVEKKKLSAEELEKAKTRISSGTSFGILAPCHLVIEAIAEIAEIKHRLFAEIEKVVATDAIIATNTSSISIASLASPLQHPERFCGLHFFNPAHIMKLVEVVKGPKSAAQVITFCVDFAKHLGKTPVVAKDVPGFIVNRVARNFYNEPQRIVMEGAAQIPQVDRLIRALGFKMGPFELMDLIGVDVNLDVTKSQWEQFFYEPRFAPSMLQQSYVDAGLHGKKTGGGFTGNE